MATPPNQVTLRCAKTDVELFKQLKTELVRRSTIAPKDGEIHRAIYHRGLLDLCVEVGVIEHPESSIDDLPDSPDEVNELE